MAVSVIWILLMMVAVSSAAPATYGDLKRRVLLNLPWGKAKETTTTAPCVIQQCKIGKNLCKNGGVCQVTKDCNFKCKCPNGYTGWFCGVKAPAFVTTTSVNLPTVTHGTLSSVHNRQSRIIVESSALAHGNSGHSGSSSPKPISTT